MKVLFDRVRDFDDDVFRNIVSLRESQDLFDDLTVDEGATQYAIAAEAQVKSNLPPGVIERGFDYTTAVDYPFTNEPYLLSRYGNGSFGVWYGALDLETTLYETLYHTVREESKVEGLSGILKRERAVYLVRTRAILINLVGKEKKYPELIADSYALTQQIAERVHKEHPGLLATSARYSGTNLIAFTPKILSNPRVNCYLTYTYDYHKKSAVVERRPGEVILERSFA